MMKKTLSMIIVLFLLTLLISCFPAKESTPEETSIEAELQDLLTEEEKAKLSVELETQRETFAGQAQRADLSKTYVQPISKPYLLLKSANERIQTDKARIGTLKTYIQDNCPGAIPDIGATTSKEGENEATWPGVTDPDW